MGRFIIRRKNYKVIMFRVLFGVKYYGKEKSGEEKVFKLLKGSHFLFFLGGHNYGYSRDIFHANLSVV